MGPTYRDIKAGRFTADVGGPYPCWVHLRDESDGKIVGISHQEIGDLIHVLERARTEMKIRLGKDAYQVS